VCAEFIVSDTGKPGSVPRSAPPYGGSGSDPLRRHYGSWSADVPASTSSVSQTPASKVNCTVCVLSSVVR